MNLDKAVTLHAARELRRPLIHNTSRWRTICVDFDGVLSDSHGPYSRGHFGPPIPEGMKLLAKLKAEGFDTVILTARKETDLVANWLAAQGFPGMIVTNHKIPAVAYVDDRALAWSDNSKASDVLKLLKKPMGVLDERSR